MAETKVNQEKKDQPESPDALSPDEIADYRRLRKEQADREAAEQKAREDEEAARPANSHWLHLANGEVIESAGTATHVDGIAVIGSYPITEKESEKA